MINKCKQLIVFIIRGKRKKTKLIKREKIMSLRRWVASVLFSLFLQLRKKEKLRFRRLLFLLNSQFRLRKKKMQKKILIFRLSVN